MVRRLNEFRKLDEIKMKEGEEFLASVIKPVQGTWTLDKAFVGIDGGNTQNRLVGLDKLNLGTDLEDYFIIPSAYGMSTISDEEIKPQGQKLYNKMDTTITSNASVGSKVLFNKVRIIRGTKKQDASFNEGIINPNIAKMDSPTYYINIIDSLGYFFMCRHADNVPKEVNLKLGLSLRPGEVIHANRLQLFRDRIIHKFTWKNDEYGIEIVLNIQDVEVKSEPESQQLAQYMIPNEDGTYEQVPEYTLAIMGGGSNSAVEVLHQDRALRTASQMFEECGDTFIRDIAREVARKRPFTPSLEEVEKSLKTGLVKYGNDTIDISVIIASVVEKYGNNMFNKIMSTVFDVRTGLKLEQINITTFSGRFLRKCKFKWSEELAQAYPRFENEALAEEGLSIADVIMELLNPLSPKTDFEMIDDNLIPLGNLLAITEKYPEEVDAIYEEADEVEEKQIEELVISEEITETVEVANSNEEVVTIKEEDAELEGTSSEVFDGVEI